MSTGPLGLHGTEHLTRLTETRPPDITGRSKELWLLPDDLCLVRLIPSLRSFTYGRDELVDETGPLRLDFYERAAARLTGAGIRSAFRGRVARTTYLAEDRPAGAVAVAVAIDGKPAGVMILADELRAGTARLLGELRALGIERIVLATGDRAEVARVIAFGLPIDLVRAELTPDQKVLAVLSERKSGPVMMIGDGVNDAPALAAADVGIAMGTGTDVAIESAGVTLLTGDLTGLVRARRLSVATMRNIRQNLAFAFFYNAAGIPIAAGVLYPVFGILLSPMVGAAAMALSSVSVIGNALRLAHTRLD